MNPRLPLPFLDLPRDDDGDRIACRMRAAVTCRVMVRSRSGPWSIILSRDEMGWWMFSAAFAADRDSTKEDWQLLGYLTSAMGAHDVPRPKSIEINPRGVHRWHWSDTPQTAAMKDAAEDGLEMGDFHVRMFRRAGLDGMIKINHAAYLAEMHPLRLKNGHKACDCTDCKTIRETSWSALVEKARAANTGPTPPLS